ncbi:MAG: hypothetical protein K0S80_4193 [Neobacillus sp.]|nr:hypothetical protein [Neobacillus sp.]
MKAKIVCSFITFILIMGCANQESQNNYRQHKKKPLSKITNHDINKITINKSAVIDFIGSSVTSGYGATTPNLSWVERLHAYLSKSSDKLMVNNRAISGYSTADVINNDVVGKVIADKPDLIIFEDCLINDFGRPNLGADKSYENMQLIINQLKTALPKSKIVILPPNITMTSLNNTKSAIGNLTYTEYVKNIGDKVSHLNGVMYIDFWPRYDKLVRQNNLQLQDTLIQDGIHPNDIGYDFWFNSIKGYFIVK